MSPVPPQSVTVVLPSYNEKDNIVEAITRIEAVLGNRLGEIIVVDDNSPDETWKRVEELRHPKCRLMRRMDKKGLASALADGVSSARTDIVVWLDCDLGISPENILQLLDKLDQYQVAFGSRYVPGGDDTRAPFRSFLSYAFNVYASLVLGFHIRDYTSGFAACRKEVMIQTPITPVGFGDYFIEWIWRVSKKGITIAEVPYVYNLRKAGVSKTDADWTVFIKLAWQYALRVLQTRVSGK